MSTFLRTIFFYMTTIATMRIMGKRQLSQMEPSEVVVAMLVSDLAAAPMLDPNVPLWKGLLPIAGVLLMELAMSELALRSVKLRKLLCGKPVILIDKGKFVQENLRRTRINLDELTGKLREKDVLDISQVQYAILETGGNISVFPFPQEVPASAKNAGIQTPEQSLPYTIICDGRLVAENLQKSGKNHSWLEKTLKARNATVASTFLLTVDDSNTICFYPKT